MGARISALFQNKKPKPDVGPPLGIEPIGSMEVVPGAMIPRQYSR